MKIYTIEQVEKIIREQKYKHCGLYRQDGGKWKGIVPFNRGKGEVDLALKNLKEIRTRMNVLDDGFYSIRCCAFFTPHVEPDVYTIKKGNLPDDAAQPVNVTVNVPGLKEQKHKSENVLSLDSALDYVKENAALKSDNAVLKAENDRLKIQIEELESELDEDEEESEGLSDGFKNFFSADSPFAVMADKFFALEERKLRLKEVSEHAKLTGRYKSNGNAREKTNTNGKPVPPAKGSARYEAYISKLEGMTDEDFAIEMDNLAKAYPEFYEIVKGEFEESNEQENESTKNNF